MFKYYSCGYVNKIVNFVDENAEYRDPIKYREEKRREHLAKLSNKSNKLKKTKRGF